MSDQLSLKELEKEFEKELNNSNFSCARIFSKNINIEKLESECVHRKKAKKVIKELDAIFEEIRIDDEKLEESIAKIQAEAAVMPIPELKALKLNLKALTIEVRKNSIVNSKGSFGALLRTTAINAFLNRSKVSEHIERLTQLAHAIQNPSSPVMASDNINILGPGGLSAKLASAELSAKEAFILEMNKFYSSQRSEIIKVIDYYQQVDPFHDDEPAAELDNLIALINLFAELRIEDLKVSTSSVVCTFGGLEQPPKLNYNIKEQSAQIRS